jgi:hypothetical protein
MSAEDGEARAMPGFEIRGPRAKGASPKEILSADIGDTGGLTNDQVVALRDLIGEVLSDENVNSTELKVYLYALTETVLRGKTENETHATVIARKIKRNADTTRKALRRLKGMGRLEWTAGDLLEWGRISLPSSVAATFGAHESGDASSSRCIRCGAVGDHHAQQGGGAVCDGCFEPF